jgi:beta-phosphoglucomutase-like phosphatase (HAD superfamily)
MNRVSCAAKLAFKKVTHVIFDLDGLLLDTESLYTKAAQSVVSKYGKTYTYEIKQKVLGFTGVDAAQEIRKRYTNECSATSPSPMVKYTLRRSAPK